MGKSVMQKRAAKSSKKQQERWKRLARKNAKRARMFGSRESMRTTRARRAARNKGRIADKMSKKFGVDDLALWNKDTYTGSKKSSKKLQRAQNKYMKKTHKENWRLKRAGKAGKRKDRNIKRANKNAARYKLATGKQIELDLPP